MTSRFVCALAVICLAVSTACRVGPIGYPISPGISASFPPSQRMVSNDYAQMFCSVLAEFANEKWETCNKYVDMQRTYAPGELEKKLPEGWVVLRLGGFGAQCLVKTAETFKDAATHLATHGVPSEHITLGAFDTSEDNAIRIRQHVLGYMKQHPKDRIILLAHSKGAADAMVALTSYPTELTAVKALITVAGAVGGSHLVDDLVGLNERLLRQLQLPTCIDQRKGGGGPNAIDSMRREVRQKFLYDHEPLKVPSFSISAVSTKERTSKILVPLWNRVAPYALEQDSHLVERETIVPGGTFLGRALGDHWAVAFPFDPNPEVKPATLNVINWNKFPRPALIEAAVRIVLQKVGP
jgi:pimeloyl-ACP methyl ester carboxylesterase